MKTIALLIVFLAAAAAIGYKTHPAEFMQYMEVAGQLAVRAWESIEANPIPVAVALGTFLVTVVYLQVKGKTLRESVTLAATRVSLVPVRQPDEEETPVIKRAMARATRAQLLVDEVQLQNRQRPLAEAVKMAEKDACYTEAAVAEAKVTLEKKQKAHEEAIAKVARIRAEKAACDKELAAIAVELKKLKELV
jgi:hypothetical protein